MGAHIPSNERKDFLTEASKENEYPKVPKVAYCLAATSGRHTGTDWSRTYVVCADGVRRLTPKEYERLQGFPDYWTLPARYAVDSEDTDTTRSRSTISNRLDGIGFAGVGLTALPINESSQASPALGHLC